jgi:hypothetical protein
MKGQTVQDKLSRLAGKLAVQVAQDRNDPLYAKYEKFRGLYMEYKQAIIQKYGAAGMKAARNAINN